MRSLAWCIALAACGEDVRLGTAPDDAPVDSATVVDGHPDNPFRAGSYALAFVEPVEVGCEGDLVGMEASFQTLTRASLSFVDGTVVLQAPTATQLFASGAPIATAFGAGTLTISPDPDPQPGDPEIWGALSAGPFGSGPLATTNTQRFFGLDSATGSAARVDALGAALFENAGSAGACSVAFAASLTPQ